MAQRRRFSAEYKQRILKKADACTEPGEIGALLRREGPVGNQQREFLLYLAAVLL